MRKLRNFFVFGCVFLISVVFAIGLIFSAEIALRLIYPVISRGMLVDVKLFPYKHYVVTTQPPNLELGKGDHILDSYFGVGGPCVKADGITARFNSEGYRSPEFRNIPPKEPGEIRIIITGGSASISWNIGEACTMDNNLHNLFAKYYPNRKVRIFNLGNAAWKSFQELIALQLHGLALEPDLIIAFDGFNDIQHAFSMPIEQPYSNIAIDAFQRYERWVTGGVSGLVDELKLRAAIKNPYKKASVAIAGRTLKDHLENTYPETAKKAAPGQLGTNVAYPLDITSITKRQDFDPYNQEVVDFYLKNERLMARSASMVNAKILFVLQPILYLKTPLSPEEQDALKSYMPSINFVVQGYERMKLGLKKITEQERNASFLNMSNAFNNNEQKIFGDYCHFNREGYVIVSNELFSQIQSILKLDKTAS